MVERAIGRVKREGVCTGGMSGSHHGVVWSMVAMIVLRLTVSGSSEPVTCDGSRQRRCR